MVVGPCGEGVLLFPCGRGSGARGAAGLLRLWQRVAAGALRARRAGYRTAGAVLWCEGLVVSLLSLGVCGSKRELSQG